MGDVISALTSFAALSAVTYCSSESMSSLMRFWRLFSMPASSGDRGDMGPPSSGGETHGHYNGIPESETRGSKRIWERNIVKAL